MSDHNMTTFDTIYARRSVKYFDPAHKFTQAEEKKLNDALRQSPTSFNMQNWRFVIAKDDAVKEKLCAAAWNQAQVKDASLVYVICADLKAWDHNPARYWTDAPQDVQDILVPMIKPFYEGDEQRQRDEAMRSAGIAAQTLMLAAKAMGYDSCPMIGFNMESVANIINLPKDHTVCMIVTVGKGIKPANSKGGFLADSEVFFEDRF